MYVVDDIFSLEVPNDTTKCNEFIINKHNKTNFIGGYEGIPENLVINITVWLILLILFTIIRKNIYNYGRWALRNKRESSSGLITEEEGEADSTLEASINSDLAPDQGIFGWISALFKLKDAEIEGKCGKDAVQYLSFQRHIIVYLMVVCSCSIVIILPLNFQGTLEGKGMDFGFTTIANLEPSSYWMYVHVSLSFLFLLLAVIFTRHFSIKIKLQRNDNIASRVLMITHVPRSQCKREILYKYFNERYPEFTVTDIQLAYNTSKLIKYDQKRKEARAAKIFCQQHLEEHGNHLELNASSILCCCASSCCRPFCCTLDWTDAISYYTEKELKMQTKCDLRKEKAIQTPTGVAFVTMDCENAAEKIKADHHLQCCSSPSSVSESSVAADLRIHFWNVKSAPVPEDIYWGNLSVRSRNWYIKYFIVNTLLFLLLFFLTTPAVLISTLNVYIPINSILQKLNVMEFLSPLVLIAVASTLPVLVTASDRFLSHWTKSSENHAIMLKTFCFLMLMIIILPSLGLTSFDALIRYMFEKDNENGNFRYHCIFLPNNGAIFVNYVISSAFISTALELVRVPDLVFLSVKLLFTKSKAERVNVRKGLVVGFPFGVQYSWMLLTFAMTVIFSIPCPLITPFGLVAIILKHLTDKYNIFFVYNPSKISSGIHRSAIHFVIGSVLILQIILIFFSAVREDIKQPRMIYSVVLFALSCLIIVSNFLADMFPAFKSWKFIIDKPTDVPCTEDNPDISRSEMFKQDKNQYIPSQLKDIVSSRSMTASGSQTERVSANSSNNTSPNRIKNDNYGSINSNDQVSTVKCVDPDTDSSNVDSNSINSDS